MIFIVVMENGEMITEDDLQKVFKYINKYYSDYEGCTNCKYQPQPMQMCEWGKKRQCVELICSGWEKKDG